MPAPYVLEVHVALRLFAAEAACTSERTPGSAGVALPHVSGLKPFHMKFLEFAGAPQKLTIAMGPLPQKNSGRDLLIEAVNASLGRSFANVAFKLTNEVVDGFFLNFTSADGSRLPSGYFTAEKRLTRPSLEYLTMPPHDVVCDCCGDRGHVSSLVIVVKEGAWPDRDYYPNDIDTVCTQILYKDRPSAKVEAFANDTAQATENHSSLVHISSLESRNMKLLSTNLELQAKTQSLEAQVAYLTDRLSGKQASGGIPSMITLPALRSIPIVLNSNLAVAYPAIQPLMTAEKNGQPYYGPLPYMDVYDEPVHLRYLVWEAAPPMITVMVRRSVDHELACEDFVQAFNDAYASSLGGIGVELEDETVHGFFFTTYNACNQKVSSEYLAPGNPIPKHIQENLLKNRCDHVQECSCEAECECEDRALIPTVTLAITYEAWDQANTNRLWKLTRRGLIGADLDGFRGLVYRDDPFVKANASGGHASAIQIAHLESLCIAVRVRNNEQAAEQEQWIDDVERLYSGDPDPDAQIIARLLRDKNLWSKENKTLRDKVRHVSWLNVELDKAMRRSYLKSALQVVYEAHGVSEEDARRLEDSCTNDEIFKRYSLEYLDQDLRGEIKRLFIKTRNEEPQHELIEDDILDDIEVDKGSICSDHTLYVEDKHNDETWQADSTPPEDQVDLKRPLEDIGTELPDQKKPRKDSEHDSYNCLYDPWKQSVDF